MFIDPPSLSPTDVIPLVNEAQSASFSRIDKNKKAVAKRGLGPCSQNLLLYKEIENTMTWDDSALLKSMKKKHFYLEVKTLLLLILLRRLLFTPFPFRSELLLWQLCNGFGNISCCSRSSWSKRETKKTKKRVDR